jgi:hypothetical protein
MRRHAEAAFAARDAVFDLPYIRTLPPELLVPFHAWQAGGRKPKPATIRAALAYGIPRERLERAFGFEAVELAEAGA